MVAKICALHGLYNGAECPACQASRATSDATRRRDRATRADKIRSTRRWKLTVERILNRDGHRCTYGNYDEDDVRGLTTGGCRARKKLGVHHRVPIEDDGDPFDEENLRTLCADHHAVVEAAYRKGKRDGEEAVVEF